MSGQDSSTAASSILEAIQAMFTEMDNKLNDNNNTIINNMNKSNEAINDKFESLQAINAATREELLQKINMRFRASSRASSRETSPTQVMAKLHAKLPELSNPAVVETPHMDYSNVQVSMTDIFKDKEDADNFAEENRGRERRRPAVNQRENTHSLRETFHAINRPGNPVIKETFTRTTPENKAYLEGPLTLDKCLTFERDMLDFQQKYNVEVRYTNYVAQDLKYELRARFELSDSRFYELTQAQLHRYLAEMIAPVTKAEFLKIIKKTVHFKLPHGYIPTEQNLGTFLYALLVYKERMFRAVEFLLLYDGTDQALPACDSKNLGLLRLIADEVPFRFIQLMMDSDGPTKKYNNMYEFFKRVAIQAAEYEQLSKAAKKFSASFGGSVFEQSKRNHQHPLADTAVYRKWTPRVAVMESV